MWFKNLQIYRLPSPWAVDSHTLADQLARRRFDPTASSLDEQNQGWVAPRPDGALVYALEGQYLLSLRTEKKLLPTSVINQFTKIRVAEIAEQQGFQPGRKQVKEIKEAVRDSLLPKAFSIYQDTRVWIDSKNGWFVIEASSSSKCDAVIEALSKSLDTFPIQAFYVKLSPATVMTSCLSTGEAPTGFTVDQDAELKATGDSGATIRYVRHALDSEEVQRHIDGGKQCTRLAMTWTDRVSFTLTDSLGIKKVTPLDVLKEQNDSMAQNEEERFDSDFVLMSHELHHLLTDLTQALGGFKGTEN